jgi:hypothetical protein
LGVLLQEQRKRQKVPTSDSKEKKLKKKKIKRKFAESSGVWILPSLCLGSPHPSSFSLSLSLSLSFAVLHALFGFLAFFSP